MRVGLWITIVYIAMALGGEYVAQQADNLLAIGIGPAYQALVSGAMTQISLGISIVAMTVGIALPSIKKAEDNKTNNPEL